MTSRSLVVSLLLLVWLPLSAGATTRATKKKGSCLGAEEGKSLALALQESPLRFHCLEWEGIPVIEQVLGTQNAGQKLGKAIATRALDPNLVWCIDAAAVRQASALAKSDPAKSVLRRGIATAIVCMVLGEASAGDCDGVAALGKLMWSADGAYAEQTEDALLTLFVGSPAVVVRCWPSLAPYTKSVGLGTTNFCSERKALLRRYSAVSKPGRFLREKAAECHGSNGG